jgi:tetratricopeptide (TPR) repeat protein
MILISSPVLSGQNWFLFSKVEKQFNQAVEHYNQGHYAIAESILKKMMKKDTGEYEEASWLLLMKTNIAMDRIGEAQKIGRQFLHTYPTSVYTKDIFFSFGDIFINQGQFESAYRMFLRARKLPGNRKFLERVDDRLLNVIQLSLSTRLFDELLSIETDPQAMAIHRLAKAYSLLNDGLPDECALTLSDLSVEDVPSAYIAFYEQLLRASYQPAEPVLTVGLLLPLSGKNAADGKAFLNGFQKGYSEQKRTNGKITILIQDNRSDELEAAQAAQELVNLPGVDLIAGPLASEAVLTTTSILSSSSMPLLIPTSIQNGLSDLNGSAFQINSNLSMRGKLAARYAAVTLGLDSLAIIAPADDFGHALTDAFLQEIDRLGKSVVAIEWYSGLPMDLSRQFKSVREIAFALQPVEKEVDEELLGMEIDSLDAMFDISVEDFFNLPEKEEKQLSRSDSLKIVLNTIQGIYLPIHSGELEYVAPQFPMYNLNAKIIGNESWQDLDILTKENIGPHITGLSIITNRFVTQADSFDTGESSSELFYQGFDLAQLLLSLPIQTPSRKAVIKALEEIDYFHGISQYFSTTAQYPNVNVALQVVEFNGQQLLQRGTFQGDSLAFVPIGTP